MQHTSIVDSIQFFFITRTTGELLLLLLIVLLPLLYFLVRAFNRYRIRQLIHKRKAFIREMLETAQLQNEGFDIHLDDQAGRASYSALLDHFSDEELEFTVMSHMAQAWEGCQADIFFCVRIKQERIFYKFHVTIKSITPRKNMTVLRVRTPRNLEIGQKRAFFRIAPLPNTVRVLALWLLSPDQPLPRSTAEIGQPFLSCTIHKNAKPEDFFSLYVQDISGSGIGLKLQTSSEDKRLVKDGQILCLLVYNESMHGDERLVNFCCTGRITNIRQASEDDPTKILGIEFTNWALLEKGNHIINWFHQAKATGIGPILQWVTKMDIEQRKIPG